MTDELSIARSMRDIGGIALLVLLVAVFVATRRKRRGRVVDLLVVGAYLALAVGAVGQLGDAWMTGEIASPANVSRRVQREDAPVSFWSSCVLFAVAAITGVCLAGVRLREAWGALRARR